MILSITGLFRTILIIIGVIVIMRFIGRLMMARRQQEADNKFQREKEAFLKEKKRSEAQLGQTRVIPKRNIEAEDADFEEIK
ncbi:MAG: hypothetical protein M9897_09695 [Brumimicrobium sp.]|nr:hypothetical protein [Brumimicrobium sp.]